MLKSVPLLSLCNVSRFPRAQGYGSWISHLNLPHMDLTAPCSHVSFVIAIERERGATWRMRGAASTTSFEERLKQNKSVMVGVSALEHNLLKRPDNKRHVLEILDNMAWVEVSSDAVLFYRDIWKDTVIVISKKESEALTLEHNKIILMHVTWTITANK